MAINKFMLAALKAISYSDPGVGTDRIIDSIIHYRKYPHKMLEEQIIVDGRRVNVGIFEAKEKTCEDILVLLHGGGWTCGNIDTYSRTCTEIADFAGCTVMCVDYRLAPESPFPCALNDCYAAVKELITLFGEDKIVLIGDSAGGNLSAAVSIMANDRGEFRVSRQILIYPATNSDYTESSPFKSVAENGKDYLLTAKKLCEYMDLYVPDKSERLSPYVAPILCENLSNQPKTLIITAEFDPLRDEGEAYGEKLRKFGNTVSVNRMKDALHGFLSLPSRFSHVKKTYAAICAFLRNEVIDIEK